MIGNKNGQLARRAKFLASGILAAILAGSLVACGGGGGGSDSCLRLDRTRNAALPGCAAPETGNPGGGTTTPTTGQGPVAATAQLLVSSQQLNSDGAAPVDLTLVARDANGQAIGNRQVQLLVSDPANTAYISNFSQTTGTTHSTDANGKLTATLNLGSNKANRTIGLTATVDQATVSNSVSVLGTTLTVSGSNAVGFGAGTQLRLLVTDSAGKPISDTPVSVTSASGNPVLLTSQTTDANGKATVTVTGTKAGLDKIAASAAGANASYALNVSSHNFNFTSPVPDSNNNINKDIGTDVTITVRWTNNGAPVASQPVNFATTRGGFTTGQATASATTNASGEVSVILKSVSTGPATITASNPTSGGLAASVDVNFVSPKLASKLALQANKTTVAINPPGTDANVVTLTAVARDEDNNPVANAVVNFHIEQDPTGGSLFPASATTDAFGVARSQYVPTSQSSPTNGVIVSASAAAGAVKSSNLALTVGGQQLFVRIGTDNIVGTAPNSPNYTKLYSAFVTDAAGNPVPNATVQFLVRPRYDPANSLIHAYFKGKYVWTGVFWVPTRGDTEPPDLSFLPLDTTWSVPVPAPVGCLNEDVNFNGILDPLEDFNGNDQLDPGNAFSVDSDLATNDSGYAVATITYPKDRGNWLAVTIKATAQVAGTEAVTQDSFILPAASSDLNDRKVIPPGQPSPYGTETDCRNPL